MILSEKEILFILKKINDGELGYSDDDFIFTLQGKLSIMLELAIKDGG